MKYTKYLGLLAMLILIGLSSCKEDEISETTTIEEVIEPVAKSNNQLVYNMQIGSSTATGGLDLGCFTVDYPFGLSVDGEESTVNSEEDFINILNGEPEYIDFVYPLDITTLDGDAVSVADGEALGELFAACIPDTGWTGNDGFPAYLICDVNSCYQLVYPVSLVNGDGDTFTAEDEDEFIELLVDNMELYFEFPLSLTDEDGMIVTAETDEDLFNLVADCNTFDPGPDSTDIGITGLGCLEFVFPFNVIGLDGVEFAIADENEFVAAMFSGGISAFAYPLSMIDEEGTVVVINNDDELNELLSECSDAPITIVPFQLYILASSVGGGTCYDLVYPFSGTDLETNEVFEVNNDTEALNVAQNQSGLVGVNYPVSVVNISTGETIVLENNNAYFQLMEDCE